MPALEMPLLFDPVPQRLYGSKSLFRILMKFSSSLFETLFRQSTDVVGILRVHGDKKERRAFQLVTPYTKLPDKQDRQLKEFINSTPDSYIGVL